MPGLTPRVSRLGFALALAGALAALPGSFAAEPDVANRNGTALQIEVSNSQVPVADHVMEYLIEARDCVQLLGRPLAEVAAIEVWETDATGRPLSRKLSQLERTPEGLVLCWILDGTTPAGGRRSFAITPASAGGSGGATAVAVTFEEQGSELRVGNPWYEITLDRREGGRMKRIVYRQSGRTLALDMADVVGVTRPGAGATPAPLDGGEVDLRQIGRNPPTPAQKAPPQSARLAQEAAPAFTVSKGEIRSTLEIKATFRYSPTAAPLQATYRYRFYAHAPRVDLMIQFPAQAVAGTITSWGFFDFRFPAQDNFTRWATGEPLTGGEMIATDKEVSLSLGGGGRSVDWAAFVSRENSFGLVGPALGILRHRAGACTLIGSSRAPWRGGTWDGSDYRWEAVLYLGAPGAEAEGVQRFAASLKSPTLRVKNATLEAKLAATLSQASALRAPDRGGMSGHAGPAVASMAGLARMLARAAEERMRQGSDLGAASTFVTWAGELLAQATRVASAASPAPALPLLFQQDDYVVAGNESIGLLFKRQRLVSVFHQKNGYDLLRISPRETSGWAIALRHLGSGRAEQITDAASARPPQFHAERPAGGDLVLAWEWAQVSAGSGPAALHVRVTGRMPAQGGLTTWRLEVENPARDLAVGEVEFPVVANIGRKRGATASDFVCIPFKSGMLIRDPASGGGLDDKNDGVYGNCGMQFVPYWFEGSGLFLGTFDPDGYHKRYGLKAADGQVVEYRAYHPAPNPQLHSDRYAIPFDSVIGVFNGDWYDAAKLYRQWAIRQKWCPKQPLATNDDVPRWFKENNLTMRPRGPSEDVAAEAELAVRTFGQPLLVNWYGWTQQKDIEENWPDMSPPQAGFREAVARLRQQGLRVLPYMMSNQWDQRTPSYARDGGEAAAVRLPDGTVKVTRYHNNPLANMCPYTKVWQDKCRDLVNRMLDTADIGGMYMDLASTAVYVPCHATNHGHPAVGGNYAVEGMRALLRAMRDAARRRNPDFVMLAEGRWECMIDLEDSHLLFHTVRENLSPVNVPMFEAVYGDFIRPYGAKTAGLRPPPVEALMPMQMFIFGAQLGRFLDTNEMIARNPEQTSLYRRLADYRRALQPYLAYGEMLRPLAIEYRSPARTTLEQEHLAIQTSTWRAPDGTIAFVLGNATLATAVEAGIAVDPAAYGMPADGWELWRVTPRESTKVTAIRGRVRRQEKLAGGEVLAFVARPSRLP